MFQFRNDSYLYSATPFFKSSDYLHNNLWLWQQIIIGEYLLGWVERKRNPTVPLNNLRLDNRIYLHEQRVEG